MLLLRRKQALHSVASRLKRIGRWSKPCASCPIYIYPTRLSSITFGTTSVSRWIGSLFTFLELAWKLQDLVMFLVLFCSWMGFCFVFFAASVERGSYFPGDNLTRAPVPLLKWEMALDALDRFTSGSDGGSSLMHLLGIVTLAISAFSLHLGRSRWWWSHKLNFAPFCTYTSFFSSYPLRMSSKELAYDKGGPPGSQIPETFLDIFGHLILFCYCRFQICVWYPWKLGLSF